jgi:hypothetical protein
MVIYSNLKNYDGDNGYPAHFIDKYSKSAFQVRKKCLVLKLKFCGDHINNCLGKKLKST